MPVLELPEPGFGFGLGPVPGDHLGDGPVVVAGNQDMLAEDLVFQRLAGVLVDPPGQPQIPGLVSGQFPADDTADPRLGGDGLDPGRDFVARAAGLSARTR